ncbi:MAG: methyltransferase [Alphaproteobacteria bacterium]|nr:methyltransferase [Alphaproteobacteria bacterium]
MNNSADSPSSDTTLDAFLGGKLHIGQPRRGYRAGLDAVLLAAAVNRNEAQSGRLLDVGAGVGTVGLCAARRIESLDVTLLEPQPELCELARQNITRNGLTDRVRIVQGRVGSPTQDLQKTGLEANSFTHVVANPPFMAAGTGTNSDAHLKAASHTLETGQNLDDWGRFLARMARSGGKVLVIHKASALSDLLKALDGRFGCLRILPIHPRSTEPAHRVIVSGTRNSRAELTLLPAAIVHDDGNAFTARFDAILRSGAPLETDL